MPPPTSPDPDHGTPHLPTPAWLDDSSDEALQANAARYRALALAASDVIYRMSPDWREMHQLDGRGFLADTVASSATWLETYIAPEDQPHVAGVIAEAIRTGTPFELEHRVRQADGSMGWTHSRAVPIHDEQGEVTEWVGAARDITTHKRVQEELRASEERFRSLFTTMDEGYARYRVISDPDGATLDMEILETNPTYEHIMQRFEAAGKRLRAVEPTLDQEWLDILAQVVRAGNPQRFERYNVRLDRWFDVRVIPEAGNGTEIVLIFNDVTESKHGEDALRQTERWGRVQNAAFEAAMDGVPLVESLAILARLVHEETGGEAHTAFYLANEPGAQLHPVRGAGTMTDAYLDEVDGFRTGTDSQASGLAVPTGEPVITADVETEPRWTPWVEIARAYHYRGCWSFPIKTRQRQAVGTLVMYFQEPRAATPDDLALARIVTQTAAVLIAHHTEAEERARAEAALRASEVRYRTLFTSIDEGFVLAEVLFDATGHAHDLLVLETNPSFNRLVHVTDPIGLRARQIFPDAEPHWFAAYERVITTGEPLRTELYLQALDAWFSIYVSQIEDANNHRIVIVFNEVTERRRAADALRESETRQAFLLALSDRLRALSDPAEIQQAAMQLLAEHHNVMRAMYLEVHPDGDTMTPAARFERDAVPTPDRLHLSDYGPDIPDEFRAGRTLWVGDTEAEAETEAQREAYRAIGVRAWIVTPLVKEGQLLAVVGVQSREPRNWTEVDIGLIEELADRTWAAVERARAEVELHESEERVRAIIEEATDYAIFTTDASGIIDGWTPGARAVLGWPADEALGQPFAITFTPEDRVAGVPDQELAAARAGLVSPNVRWHLCQDGSRVFIDGVARPRVADDGAFLGLLKIGQDVTARMQAEETQREADLRYREALEAEVAAATYELRTLSRRLLVVQEAERRRLALELHDEIGQVLTGLNLQLASASRASEDASLAAAQATLSALTEQVRQLSLELRPEALDRYGLLAALEWHIRRHQTSTGITVYLRYQGLDRRFPPEVEIAAYRVVQEALTNIARYAGVTEAWVTLFADGTLLVTIQDQGRGFDPAQRPDSSGLGGMRERVELLGGTFDLETSPGRGVHITAEFPLGHLAQAQATQEHLR